MAYIAKHAFDRELKDMNKQLNITEPQCNARTLFFFETTEECEKFLENYCKCRLFFTDSGKLTMVSKALLSATAKGLGYDIAGEVFVCARCRSSSPTSLYFATNHDGCDQLVAMNTAYVMREGWPVAVPAFPLLPVYATTADENRILRMMEEAESNSVERTTLVRVTKCTAYNSEVINLDDKLHIVQHDRNAEECTESINITATTNIKPTRAYKQKKLLMRSKALEQLVNSVVKLCAKEGKDLEIVDEKRKPLFPRVPLKHMMNVPKETYTPESDVPAGTQEFLESYCKVAIPTMPVKDNEITNGWSGVVLHKNDLEEHLHKDTHNNLFVVMGRCSHGKLQNALKPTCVKDLIFYSQEKWTNKRMPIPPHMCNTKYSDSGMANIACTLLKNLLRMRSSQCELCYQMIQNDTSYHEGDEMWILDAIAATKATTGTVALNHLQSVISKMHVDHLEALQTHIKDNIVASVSKITDPKFDKLLDLAEANIRKLDNLQGIVDEQGDELEDAAKISEKAADLSVIIKEQADAIKSARLALTNDDYYDIYRMLTSNRFLPNRKIYMAPFADAFGNFNFWPRSNLKEILPEFVEEFEVDIDGNAVTTTHRFKGINNEYDTNVESLFTIFDGDWWEKKSDEARKIQPLGECEGKFGGVKFRLCQYEGPVPIYSPIVPATPSHLQFGSQYKLMRIGDLDRGKEFVIKNGYCYMYIFACAMAFADDNKKDNIVEFVRNVGRDLGPWPTFNDVLSRVRQMVVYYGCYDALVPTILVDHTTSSLHVLDPLGIINVGMHHLNVDTLGGLASWDILMSGPMREYRIGGMKETMIDIRKCVRDRKYFITKLNTDTNWLIDMMLTPSTFFVLAETVTAQNVLLKDVGENYDRLHALMNLRTVGEKLGPHLDNMQRVNEYIQSMLRNHNKLLQLCETDETKRKLTQHVSLLSMIAQEESEFLEIDRVINEKKILEEHEELHSACVFNEFINSWPCFSFSGIALRLKYTGPGKEIGAKYEALKSYWSKPWMGSCQKITRKCPTISDIYSTVRNFVGNLYVNAFRSITANVLQYMWIGCITAFGGYLLRVVIKMVKMEIREREEEKEKLVEFQSKESDTYVSKFMAVCFLIATFFSTDMSQAIYGNLMKFRTIFDILRIQSQFQSGTEIFTRLFQGLGNVETFHEIQLYDHKESTSRVSKQVKTFASWINIQMQCGTFGCDPLEGNHVSTTLLAGQACELAMRISNNSEQEYLIVGQVGCGKSTYFPAQLAHYGRVLICEPTRVLATNLDDSLQAVTSINPSVLMRNHRKTTASKVTIMTYGFALSWLTSMPVRLQDYDYILFDEVHHPSAHKVVFYNWLKQIQWQGKIIKLTATTHSVSNDIKPNFDVTIKTWPRMDVGAFMKEQGTGTSHDVTSYGKVIIVFLTSFSEIDNAHTILSKQNKFSIIKADSRTLRNKVNLCEQLEACTGSNTFILATNILQNGVNIQADVVVDFGQKIVAEVDEENRMLRTKRTWINKSDRIQRCGRVGRTKRGVAIRIGTEIDNNFTMDEITATEAALLSFGFNVAPVIQNVNTHTFGPLTMEQIKTASRFELPLPYMAWFVNTDGTMAVQVYEVFKPLLLNTGTVHLSNYYMGNGLEAEWLTITDYKNLGYVRSEITSINKVPFHSHEISDAFVERLAEALKKSKMPQFITIKIPQVNYREAATKLTTKPEHIDMALMHVSLALDEQKKILQHLQDNVMRADEYMGTLIPNIALRSRLEKQMEKITNNISKLEQHRTRIENAQGVDDYDALVNMLDENPDVAAHVMFQSGSKCFIDKYILEKRSYTWLPYVSIGVAVVMLLGTWYIMYKRRHSVKFEGKQVRLKASKAQLEGKGKKFMNRDKRNTAVHDFGDKYIAATDEWYNETTEMLDPLEDWPKKIKKKTREQPLNLQREGRPAYIFKNFYGFNENEYDKVTFLDMAMNFQTEMPVNELDLAEAFNRVYTNRIEQDAIDLRPTQVTAIFTRDGSNIGKKVTLTPHNPRQNTARGVPAGFRERANEWRQTGAAEDVQVNFEGKSISAAPMNVSHIFKQQVLVFTQYEDMHGLISGNKLIMPYHFMKDASNHPDAIIRMQTGFGLFNLGKMEGKMVRKLNQMDLVVLTLPPTFTPRKNLTCFRSPKVGEEAVLHCVEIVDGDISMKTSGETIVTNKMLKTDKLWAHFATTSHGHCGAVLVATKDKHIIGFHNMGANDAGCNYFVPVTEELLAILREENQQALVPWEFSMEEIDTGGLIVTNAPNGNGIIKQIKSCVNFQSRMMKYCGYNFMAKGCTTAHISKRHVITGKRPQFHTFLLANEKWRKYTDGKMGLMLPSALNNDAYYKDLLKYDRELMVGVVDEKCFQQAVQTVIKFLEQAGFERNGFKGVFKCDEVFNTLNMDAAMGALYQGKKRDFFQERSDDEILEMFEESIAKLARNEHGVWSGLLKAELRPEEKVLANKTRTFTSAPIDILFGAKAVVDEFNNKFYETHLRGPWTVGINKFNKGWDRLAKALSKYERYIDADGSRFDSSITPLLFNAVLNIRLTFMVDDPLVRTMLKNLYTQIVHTCILVGDGTIVQKHRGNNSGQPSTVVDNTLCLMIACEYARLRSQKDLKMLYVCNGDDLLINCDQETESTIVEEFKTYFDELELNYDFSETHQSIETVEFMSHKFMKYKDCYIPKLKEHRVLAILEWQRSNDAEAIQSAVIAAYVESFGYPELMQLIEEFWELIQHAWTLQLPTRDEVEHLYLDCQKIDTTLIELAEKWNQHLVHFESGQGAGTPNTGAGKEKEKETGDKSGGSGKNKINSGSLLSNPVSGGGNNNNASQGSNQDISDRVSTMTFNAIAPKAVTLYIPKAAKSAMNDNIVEQVRNYIPRVESLDLSFASEAQMTNWITKASQGYGLTADQFMQQLLPAWIVFCIVNTCSPANKTKSKWRAINEAGSDNETTIEYDMEPMWATIGDEPTMRQCMRHFGDTARLLMAQSKAVGRPLMPKNYRKAGVINLNDMIASCDFIVRKATDNAQFIEVQNQVLTNRVNNIVQRTFAQAAPSQGSNIDNNRHDAQDVRDGTHSFRGAMFN